MRIQSIVLITKRVTVDHPCLGIAVNTGMLPGIHGRTLKDDRERGIRLCEDKISESESLDDIDDDGVICIERVKLPDEVDRKTGIEQLLSKLRVISKSTKAVSSRHGTRCTPLHARLIDLQEINQAEDFEEVPLEFGDAKCHFQEHCMEKGYADTRVIHGVKQILEHGIKWVLDNGVKRVLKPIKLMHY